MGRKQYPLLLTLAFIGGLIGGAVSSKVFIGNPAFVQKSSQPQKVIVAEEFRLVDKNRKTCARLGMHEISGEFSPELMLTKGHGSRTGVVTRASNFRSSIDLFGEATGISMDVTSMPKTILGIEEAKLRVGFTGWRLVSVEGNDSTIYPPSLGVPYIQLNVRKNVGPSLELVDKERKARAVLGCVQLVGVATGETQKVQNHHLFSLTRTARTSGLHHRDNCASYLILKKFFLGDLSERTRGRQIIRLFVL